jgi:hypothetical protein
MSKLDEILKVGDPAPVETPAEPVTPVQPVEVASTPVTPPAVPPVPAEPAPAEPVVPAAPAFDVNSFNTFFGTSLKEEAELREALKRANEFEGVSKKYQEI